jgi:modulator of FtsH protease
MTAAASWSDFATMIGGASGALTGLLFVAVSLNANRIAGHAGLRASAAQTLVLFLTPLTIAAALLTPHQPDWVLGAELIAIGLVAGMSLLVNHRVKLGLADEDLRLISIFNRTPPNVIAMLLVLASGAIVAAGESAGLYLLFPASILAFVSGVLNAWFFLLPPPRRLGNKDAGDAVPPSV